MLPTHPPAVVLLCAAAHPTAPEHRETLVNPLTEKQIRASFVNASQREAKQATLPDLADVDWDRLDYLGWIDRKAPLAAYVVAEVDGEVVGILLRAADAKSGRGRKGMCAWCEDVVDDADVSLYVARRAGASGKAGNSVGTLVCTDFGCSRNVRRRPLAFEVGSDPERRAAFVQGRIDGLRERSSRFLAEVSSTR
ncbi:Fibronectin-binding protein (FBP) [Isoptericola dokdonensis DS-3]|uniref:Fibronectin-binding protein (FBP) n=1 Tax=Isoptericola dokdonensis DS-3 TaxID=1300344 RepID=A0A161HR96_9MICO|nr:Fibronectin-binding protein (FBP) [Isoptericola dokdonensis DS-3]